MYLRSCNAQIPKLVTAPLRRSISSATLNSATIISSAATASESSAVSEVLHSPSAQVEAPPTDASAGQAKYKRLSKEAATFAQANRNRRAKIGRKDAAAPTSRGAKHYLEKSIGRIIVATIDYRDDNTNIQVLHTVKKLVTDTHRDILMKAMTHGTFRLILGKLYTYNKYYLSKLNRLQKVYNTIMNKNKLLSGSGKSGAMKWQSQEDQQVHQKLEMTRLLHKNCLYLTRDFFRIFEENEGFSKGLTVQDYELVAKLEVMNHYPNKALQIFQAVEKKFGPLQKCLNDAQFWNLQFKVLSNATPQLWRYIPSYVQQLGQAGQQLEHDRSGYVRVARTNWRGNLPFEVSTNSLLREFVSLVDQKKLEPNLETYIKIILSLGHDKDLQLLKEQLKLIWGVDPQNPDAEAVSPLDRDDPLYPNLGLMKAIVTAFGINNQFLDSLEYVAAFEAKYDLAKDQLKRSSKDEEQLWEVIMKWAIYNTALPADANAKQFRSLLQARILLEAETETSAAEKLSSQPLNKNIFTKIRTTKEQRAAAVTDSQVQLFQAKLVQERDTVLDNVFRQYLRTRAVGHYAWPMFRLRMRSLHAANRLEQLVAELPIVYDMYLLTPEDALAANVYNVWLLSVLEASFKNPEAAELVIAHLKLGHGPLFMYFSEQRDQRETFDSNVDVRAIAEAKEQFDGLLGDFKARAEVEMKAPVKNFEILQLLEFYRLRDQGAMNAVYAKYISLSQAANAAGAAGKRAAESVGNDDEDDMFFGVL